MAVTTKTRKVKVARPKALMNGAKKLTKAEKKKLTGEPCYSPGAPGCPLVNKKDSPYMYQTGCRAEPCKTANRNYYKAWRDAKAAAAAKEARRKARAKKAKAVKKTATKRRSATK